tara:strand:+ start:1388 stop:1588 length:201 start_codon:yes stop_codon:yes gene_type:complete
MRYMVYWKNMLKNKQGDAPMRDFDTTIEARAYIRGCIDIIVTFDKTSTDEKLLQEFEVKTIKKGNL